MLRNVQQCLQGVLSHSSSYSTPPPPIAPPCREPEQQAGQRRLRGKRPLARQRRTAARQGAASGVGPGPGRCPPASVFARVSSQSGGARRGRGRRGPWSRPLLFPTSPCAAPAKPCSTCHAHSQRVKNLVKLSF